MEPKYKVGQCVKIPDTKPRTDNWNDRMNQFLGKITTVRDTKGNSSTDYAYHLEIDKGQHNGNGFNWEEKWLTPVAESREELNKALLNGEIDITTYQELIKDTP